MKHETHLPAQQAQTQKKIWISSAHENRRGTKSPQSAPQSGKKSFSSLKFPKTLRLRKRRDFLRVSKGGRRVVGKFICIDSRVGVSLKLGITASTKYGSSPERNRFKRLVREAFRIEQNRFPKDLEIHVIPRQRAKSASLADIQQELLRLLEPACDLGVRRNGQNLRS